MPKPKNIIIFASIAAVFVLVYMFFVREPATSDTNLVTTAAVPLGGTSPALQSTESAIAGDFLGLLLNVKNIGLDDSIFLDPAWISLKDSSIALTPLGTEGRVNPFAPFGTDAPLTPNQP